MSPEPIKESRGMTFLHYNDPRFFNGLSRHQMSGGQGYRIVSPRFSGTPFPHCFPEIEQCLNGTAPFHLDRILGGAPYLDLDGIDSLAARCAHHPGFLGFQAHEWEHSPIIDQGRIRKHFTDVGLAFNAENFRPFRNRHQAPFFSGGNEEIYRHLPRDLSTPDALLAFYRGYYQHFASLTHGQIMSVNGHFQLHHLAAELGARSVFAEIGNQVPLSSLQISSARGAGRQFGLPWGVYYEPWGGKPTSCTSALNWSPWFGENIPLDEADQGLALPMGRDQGSSRSLQRRLMIYSWLSGAGYVSEEWGPENYFENWEDFPLTRYGAIMLELDALAAAHPRPEPIVPIALLMPPGVPGVDNRYLITQQTSLPIFRSHPADRFHERLRIFCHEVLGAREATAGLDDFNLTPSPFIGGIDLLSHDASPELLDAYDLIVCFTPEQTAASERTLFYEGTAAQSQQCRQAIVAGWPVRIEGEVGATLARVGQRYWVGLFNNLGVSKEGTLETILPGATRSVRLTGPLKGVQFPLGSHFLQSASEEEIIATIPAGEVMLIAFSQR